MEKIFPAKLKKGDHVRVIAPSRSLSLISHDIRKIADGRLSDLGFKVSFGKHVEEQDEFLSSSVQSRVEDLRDAFRDDSVQGILTVIGGFNSNQLLRSIDWDVIRTHPKVFMGYSDITALNNAMYTKIGLVSYSGPHYSTFGQNKYFDYTLDHFKKCVMEDGEIKLDPSTEWFDDFWWQDQEKRNPIVSEGYWVINNGEATGTLLGANLCTFNLLQGTEYMPDLKNSILFIEDDEESKPHHFDRDLVSLIHQPRFDGVRGVVIGRFQKASGVTKEILSAIIHTKPELEKIPVIGNVDFGHTDPKITFPIGGEVRFGASTNEVTLTLLKH